MKVNRYLEHYLGQYSVERLRKLAPDLTLERVLKILLDKDTPRQLLELYMRQSIEAAQYLGVAPEVVARTAEGSMVS